MTGRISLYFEGAMVATRKYNALYFKEQVIETWKRIYGKGFYRAQVIDVPDPPTLKAQKKADAEKMFVPQEGVYKKGYLKPTAKIPKPSTKTWDNWK